MMRAKIIDDEVKKLVKLVNRSWVKLGALCLEMSEKRLFEDLGYQTFNEWLSERVPDRGRSQAYVSMRAVKQLIKFIKNEDLEEISVNNAKLLAKLPESKRSDPTIIEAAKTQTENEFHLTIEKECPGQHLEKARQWGRWVEASIFNYLEGVLLMARCVESTTSDSEALEAIFRHYEEDEANIEAYKPFVTE